MKILDKDTREEIQLEDWFTDTHRTPLFTGLTKCQHHLCPDDIRNSGFYTKIGRKRILLRLKAMSEIEHIPEKPILYYDKDAKMAYIVTGQPINDLLEQIFNRIKALISTDVHSGGVLAYSVYPSERNKKLGEKFERAFESMKKNGVLLYFKGRW